MRERIYLGDTDIASFICRSPGRADVVPTGEDGPIYAYITDDPSEITEDHQLEIECGPWMDIYDDERRTFRSTDYGPNKYNRYSRIRLFHLPEAVWDYEKENFRWILPPGSKGQFLIVLEGLYKEIVQEGLYKY